MFALLFVLFVLFLFFVLFGLFLFVLLLLSLLFLEWFVRPWLFWSSRIWFGPRSLRHNRQVSSGQEGMVHSQKH